eukprot:9487936-Pyramimonas_sp.AAC.1
MFELRRKGAGIRRACARVAHQIEICGFGRRSIAMMRFLLPCRAHPRSEMLHKSLVNEMLS